MAQFDGASLRTWMARERMHFYRQYLDELERLRLEAATARAAERRRREKRAVARWKRIVEQMVE